MDTVVEKLLQLRERRHDAAYRKYSEILLRFDRPSPGDAEALDAAMSELHFDLRHVQGDVRLIEQFREYQKGEKHTGGGECRKDADAIRRTHSQLFAALDGET